MVRNSRQDFKVYGNVFDTFTNERIRKLHSQHHFDELASPISIGKEANIFTAKKDDGSMVILKIYRLHTCNFNQMFDYIKSDPRYANLKKKRREIIFNWAQREYRNLLKAREKVSVPKPIAIIDHILVLEMIGDDAPSPRLKDNIPDDREDFAKKLMDEMKKLRQLGMVHADLSEFNILNYRETPILIDFSQSTTSDNQRYEEYWDRDIKNVARFFKKMRLKITEDDIKKKIMEK